MDIYGIRKVKQIIGQKCDGCGTKLTGIPITISFGFGSPLDGEKYHFCDFKCAIEFLILESAKINPRTDIEFGKEK
jgi:hypothetical protein